jgi:uncharacterized membrane protein
MDLILIFITSILVIPLVVLTDGAARTVLGLLLIVFFPGYCLMAVLFPRKTPLGVIPRIAFSVATSIVLLVIFQLVMDATSIGIELYPALIYLVVFTTIAAGVAGWRRRSINHVDRYAPDFRKLSGLTRFWSLKSRLDWGLIGLLSIAIIGTITTIGFVITGPTAVKSFTEFYILDPVKKVDYYPGELAPGETGEVIVGIVNREREAMAYSLEVVLDGEIINVTGPINLEKDESWEQALTFTPVRTGPDQKIEFLLYRDNRQLYRTLHIWVDVSAGVT